VANYRGKGAVLLGEDYLAIDTKDFSDILNLRI
jgi:hypothetical protein